MLDKIEVEAFAARGIELVPTTHADFVWTHSPYLRHEDVKDIEIRIRAGNYMGPIVHSELHKGVKFEEARDLAESILAAYRLKVKGE